MPGYLHGVRVVELASDAAAFAGKLLAGLGAEVIVVEPPGGHASRTYEPFVDDVAGPERSLWWRHYQMSKKSVTIDLSDDRSRARFRNLVATADIVLEAEPPGHLATLGLAYTTFERTQPSLIWVSVTPFGSHGARSSEQAVDLTVQAAGGPAWSCGYDDHTLPPVRPGGNQGYHTGSVWAVVGALTALVHRDLTGVGQRVDTSMHAAVNVTTEVGSYSWLVAQRTVQRQTGRHASWKPTMETVAATSDGGAVTTGMVPRVGREYRVLLSWLQDLGLADHFDDLVFLQMGAETETLDLALIGVDPVVTEIYRAGRSAMVCIAQRLGAYEFFIEGQQRGFACGLINAPEETIVDPHLVARGFPVTIDDDVIDRTYVAAGAPFISNRVDYVVERAPSIGEHNALLDELVLDPLDDTSA